MKSGQLTSQNSKFREPLKSCFSVPSWIFMIVCRCHISSVGETILSSCLIHTIKQSSQIRMQNHCFTLTVVFSIPVEHSRQNCSNREWINLCQELDIALITDQRKDSGESSRLRCIKCTRSMMKLLFVVQSTSTCIFTLTSVHRNDSNAKLQQK